MSLSQCLIFSKWFRPNEFTVRRRRRREKAHRKFAYQCHRRLPFPIAVITSRTAFSSPFFFSFNSFACANANAHVTCALRVCLTFKTTDHIHFRCLLFIVFFWQKCKNSGHFRVDVDSRHNANDIEDAKGNT